MHFKNSFLFDLLNQTQPLLVFRVLHPSRKAELNYLELYTFRFLNFKSCWFNAVINQTNFLPNIEENGTLGIKYLEVMSFWAKLASTGCVGRLFVYI